jgi:hypothetical protein
MTWMRPRRILPFAWAACTMSRIRTQSSRSSGPRRSFLWLTHAPQPCHRIPPISRRLLLAGITAAVLATNTFSPCSLEPAGRFSRAGMRYIPVPVTHTQKVPLGHFASDVGLRRLSSSTTGSTSFISKPNRWNHCREVSSKARCAASKDVANADFRGDAGLQCWRIFIASH